MLKRISILIIAVIVVLAIAQVAWAFSGSGSGILGDPYVITNVDQLQEMNNARAAYYVLGNDIDASATSDWNAGAGFVPIGNSTTTFTGNFDGQNHTITGLYINRNSIDNVGLFGQAGTGSVIKNVGMVNVTVTGKRMVGGLVGYNQGAISNSYSTGTVTGTNVIGASERVGGLVGQNSYTIYRCYSEGNVVGVGGNTGGLVGMNFGGTGREIRESYSTADVNGSSDNIGGLVGNNWNGGKIFDSYATGSVGGSGGVVGGLVGLYGSSGNVDNSYSTGLVTGASNLGGLVGASTGGTSTDSFWNTETSGQASSSGGTGKTTAEMKTTSTFTGAGWDFVNIWQEVANDYPHLAWEVVTPPDITSPTVSTLSPADNATVVAVDSNLVITFSEAVDAETGNINLYKTTGDVLVQAFNVTTDITGSGTTIITANPTSNLLGETNYYVKIDATAFDDAASNSFAGIADTTTWNFTTADVTNPTRSSGSPSGSQSAGTTQITMSLTTDENATCKYSSTAGTAYGSMTGDFSTTGGTSHSVTISGLSNGQSYNYYVRCQDGSNNANSDDYTISFSVASPSGGGGLPSAAYNPPIPPTEGFSVLINNDALETNSRNVNLTLRGGPNTTKMAISNYSDFRNAGQETYQTTKTWTLTEGEGVKIVYVKFYTQWGQPSNVVSDSIIFKKEKPIIEKIKEIPEKIVEEIVKIPEIIKEIIKPKPLEEKPKLPPVEEVVLKEAPLSMKGKWQLLPPKPIREFVLTPLPKEIIALTEKFPELGKTFEKLGISKITDIERLKETKLILPGLTQKGMPIAQLSEESKEKIPTEIVFAKTGGELIDFNIALTVTEKGEVRQKITTLSNKPLQLSVKPEKPVKSVKGYVVFRSKPQKAELELPQNSLLASLIFAFPVFAVNHNPAEIETRLVLLEFGYTDPDNDGIYTAEIQAPVVEGEYEIITVMDYKDLALGAKEIRLITVVDPEGYVWTQMAGGIKGRIPGAIVSLFWLNPEIKQYELWPAKKYQQENPQITDDTGKYSFLVPEGIYYLTAEAPSYLSYEGEAFEVKEGSGIHTNIELKSKQWWLEILSWEKILLIFLFIIVFTLAFFLLYNFYRDKIDRIKK